jgi:hypothetical protein
VTIYVNDVTIYGKKPLDKHIKIYDNSIMTKKGSVSVIHKGDEFRHYIHDGNQWISLDDLSKDTLSAPQKPVKPIKKEKEG